MFSEKRLRCGLFFLFILRYFVADVESCLLHGQGAKSMPQGLTHPSPLQGGDPCNCRIVDIVNFTPFRGQGASHILYNAGKGCPSGHPFLSSLTFLLIMNNELI
jgi:hypothetical protein